MQIPTSLLLLIAWCCLTESVIVPSKALLASRPKAESTGPIILRPEAKSASSLATKPEPSKEPPVAKRVHDSFDKFGDKYHGKDKHPISTIPEHTHKSGKFRSMLGHHCDPAGPESQCGDGGLVCNHAMCSFCSTNRECPSLHQCFLAMSGENVCIPEPEKAWEKVSTDPYHMLCSVLIFFSAVLASAAGTGGGGMFVPLLVLFSVMKAEMAVPLSQCMILCSSFVNLVTFISQRHPNSNDRAKIDYNCIVLFEPMLCLGVTLGVLLHRISPQWFLLACLCVTLGLALWRTLRKGLKQWQEEKCIMGTPGVSPRNSPSFFSPRSYWQEVYDITSQKSTHLIGILFVWLLMFMASFHGLSPCTTHFIVFMTALACLLILCTFIVVKHVMPSPESPRYMKQVDWLAQDMGHSSLGHLTFPLLAFGGGVLGGLLGLGGGIIMSPVLLEVGMHSESVQATTAMIVFLSSSLATIQFALLSQIVWHYALWYGTITVLATFLGQYLCEVHVRRTGRYSFITLAIAAVLGFSLISLAFVGSRQVYEDIKYGQQMWWSTAGLCSSGRFPLFDIDQNPIVNPSHMFPDHENWIH